MRLGYLLPRLLLVACLWAFFNFAFDPILRWSVVAGGQAVTGAKVDVELLDTRFFPPGLEMRGVAVANPTAPMTNLVAFDRLRFSIWGRPLLRRKVVVEEALVDGVRFGTPRETSGELPRVAASGTASDHDLGLDRYFDALNDRAAALGTAWLDDLVDRIKLELDPNQLAAVKFAGALEEQWTGRLGAMEQRVRGLETRLKGLKASVESVPNDPVERIRAIQLAADEARTLMSEAKAIRAELTGLGTAARGDFEKLDVVRQQDIATIRSKADLLKLDAGEITESLVGPTVSRKLSQAGEWLAWAQRYGAAFSTPAPQRLRGVDFTFPRPEDDLPGLLVRKLYVGGEFQFGERPLPFKAIVTDVTNEPRQLDRPTFVKLLSDGETRIEVDAMLDQRPDVPIQDVTIVFAHPLPTELVFGEPGDGLRVGVTAARTDWKARFRVEGRSMQGQVHFAQSPVALVSEAGAGVEEQVARVIAGSLANVDRLEVDVTIGGTFDRPEWTMKSDLGEQVAGGLENFLAGELESRKAQLMARANAIIAERTGELQAKLDGRFREVLAELDLEELNAQQLIGRLAGGRLDRFGNVLPAGMQERLGGLGGLGGGEGGDGASLPDPAAKFAEKVEEQLDPAKLGGKLGEKLDPQKLGIKENPFERLRRR
jgi:uncharacterized protein (TIGR03545 family)